MKRWRITAAARADLLAIGWFTERRWGRAKRVSYFDRLDAVIERLAENPRLGRERQELGRGLFSFAVGRHVIFYAVDSEHAVTIVRVLHQAMDPDIIKLA